MELVAKTRRLTEPSRHESKGKRLRANVIAKVKSAFARAFAPTFALGLA